MSGCGVGCKYFSESGCGVDWTAFRRPLAGLQPAICGRSGVNILIISRLWMSKLTFFGAFEKVV